QPCLYIFRRRFLGIDSNGLQKFIMRMNNLSKPSLCIVLEILEHERKGLSLRLAHSYDVREPCGRQRFKGRRYVALSLSHSVDSSRRCASVDDLPFKLRI